MTLIKKNPNGWINAKKNSAPYKSSVREREKMRLIFGKTPRNKSSPPEPDRLNPMIGKDAQSSEQYPGRFSARLSDRRVKWLKNI